MIKIFSHEEEQIVEEAFNDFEKNVNVERVHFSTTLETFDILVEYNEEFDVEEYDIDSDDNEMLEANGKAKEEVVKDEKDN